MRFIFTVIFIGSKLIYRRKVLDNTGIRFQTEEKDNKKMAFSYDSCNWWNCIPFEKGPCNLLARLVQLVQLYLIMES